MKRTAAAVAILAALGATITWVGANNRDAGREPSIGRQASAGPSDPDTALQQSIERAKERQARVDGLADRLDPQD